MTEEKVKNDLKATFLGYEEIEQTNFVTGEITVREQLRQTSKLDTGDMYQYMTNIEAWCAQFGLQLTIPHSSEYMKLKEQQERWMKNATEFTLKSMVSNIGIFGLLATFTDALIC
nr:hypothetical protein [Providencia sp. PROV128]